MKPLHKTEEIPVFVVGSGNGESVLHLEENLQLDRKYEVNCYELYGGSGVNYTLRLLNAGTPVFPVISLGADELGTRIRKEILSAACKAEVSETIRGYLESGDFLNENLTTQRAVILVEAARRTIFAEKMRTGAEHYFEQVKKAVAFFKKTYSREKPCVMIGHIHSDHPECCSKTPGECARHVIENLAEDCSVFCNFGSGQICLGADYWEEEIGKAALFQLNLGEIKRFFSNRSSNFSLAEIFEWFRRREVTLVITLDKFGSVASYKNGSDGVIVSWPREIPGFLDPTGAGDAFFSGLAHTLHHNPEFTFSDFYNAIEIATVWATYACGQFGGSSNCPDRNTLQNFRSEFYNHGKNSQIITMKEADLILRVFDRMTAD